jgi:DNA mismatch repair ATPase MutS
MEAAPLGGEQKHVDPSLDLVPDLQIVDFVDSQRISHFKDLLDTDCASLVSIFVKLEELLESSLLDSKSADIPEQYASDIVRARFILQKNLASFVLYKNYRDASVGLQSIWTFFTKSSNKLEINLEDLLNETQSCLNSLLCYWFPTDESLSSTKSPPSTVKLTDHWVMSSSTLSKLHF